MTSQYHDQDINYSSDDASVFSSTLGGTQQGTTDTAVLNYVTITSSSAAHFTVTTAAAATATGTEVVILQPGAYFASMSLAIAASACAIGISLGATAAPFTTTPVAIGTVDGMLVLASNTVADASVQQCGVTFNIAPDDIDGTANVVRFMGTVGAGFVTTQVAMRIDRLTAF
jgi:hypothetical protein